MRRTMIMMGLISTLGWWSAPVWARDDFQTWHGAEIVKRLGPTWDLAFLPELRFRHDAGQLFREEYRESLRWKPSIHLQIGLNYLFAKDRASGKPREEHTGELDVTPKTSVGSWDLSVRGRVALRTIQRSAGEQEWQLRLMPKIAYRTAVAGHQVAPYLADDLFYEYTRKAWNQNRLYLGVSVPVGSAAGAEVSLDVYYMLQHQLGARRNWNNNHVVGTRWGVKF